MVITAIKENILALTNSVLTTKYIFIYTIGQAALYLRVSSKIVKEFLDLLVI